MATVFPLSCASRAWFGGRPIAQQPLRLPLAALHLFPTATSIPLFPLPAPAAKATLRSQARLRLLPSRSRVRLSPPRRRLLRQRRPRDWRIVKTTAATRTGMALRPGVRSESTTRDRAARQATTSGARVRPRALGEFLVGPVWAHSEGRAGWLTTPLRLKHH